MRSSLICVVLIAGSYVDFAYADGVDWKLYGWAGAKEDVKELFYSILRGSAELPRKR